MAFTRGRFGTLGGSRRLVWGSTPRARSVRPNTPSPFFRAQPKPDPRGLMLPSEVTPATRTIAA